MPDVWRDTALLAVESKVRVVVSRVRDRPLGLVFGKPKPLHDLRQHHRFCRHTLILPMPPNTTHSPPPYSLHRAAPADLPAILALLQSLGEQHIAYDPGRWTLSPSLPEAYRNWLENNHDESDVFCLLAQSSSGQPLGYVLAQAMPEDAKYFTAAHVYIHDIYLAPAARGTGLAADLLTRVRTWGTARGLRSFRALIATPNAQSLAFFAKHGFRPTATEVSQEWL